MIRNDWAYLINPYQSYITWRSHWSRHETAYDDTTYCVADTRLRTILRRHETSYDLERKRDFLRWYHALCGADTRLLTIWRRHETSYDDTTYRMTQTRDFLRSGADTRLLTIWRHETSYDLAPTRDFLWWYHVLCGAYTRPFMKNNTIDDLLFVLGAKSTFTRFLDHTQRRATVGRSPLDEWSARRRVLYLTIHNTTDIHAAGGIRTHNLSRRAAADLRLRPRGHWDRHLCSSSFR